MCFAGMKTCKIEIRGNISFITKNIDCYLYKMKDNSLINASFALSTLKIKVGELND